jgi:hypothetical protein
MKSLAKPMTTRVMQIITGIYRLPGSQTAWRVVLGCDHRLSVRGAELEQKQLFVGKAMVCGQCGREKD